MIAGRTCVSMPVSVWLERTEERKVQKPQQGQKAIFLNLKNDGLKIRSAAFRNKKAYDRKVGKKVDY